MMKGARVDLRVSRPRGAGWGLRPVATRVFAWHFWNNGKFSWAEFTRPHPQNRNSYFWHVDHTNKKPTLTLADTLKVVRHIANETKKHCARVRCGWAAIRFNKESFRNDLDMGADNKQHLRVWILGFRVKFKNRAVCNLIPTVWKAGPRRNLKTQLAHSSRKGIALMMSCKCIARAKLHFVR